jgi:hypothetical protein
LIERSARDHGREHAALAGRARDLDAPHLWLSSPASVVVTWLR